MCAGLLLSDTSELQVQNRRVGYNTVYRQQLFPHFAVDLGSDHRVTDKKCNLIRLTHMIADAHTFQSHTIGGAHIFQSHKIGDAHAF